MKGLLDAIYWRFHRSYILNERSEAEKYLSMLEDSMKDDSALKGEIGPIHFERFLKMRDSSKKGDYRRLYGTGSECLNEPFTVSAESPMPEKDFCRSLLKQKTAILEAVGCDPSALIVPEQEMDPYGRCDLLFRQARVWKALEVKMGEAPTSIVSQIDKYRVWCELQMSNGQHDQVDAYVLAESYPKYVISELTRLSVIVLTHSGTPESVKRVA